jgi:SPOR domain
MNKPDTCQECGAPLDRQQRYCVNCAARSPEAVNPASRYFAAASRQRRKIAADKTAPATRSSSLTGAKTASVFFFALLPIAVAVGVLVGRNGTSPDQQAILDALKNSNATAATASSDAGSGTPVSDTSLLSSDFSLDKGYTVKIGALPIADTDQAAADSATSDAEGKGAKDVGIINPGDFTTSPDQGQDDYILYSGEFSDKGAADKALTGLKKDFPDAVVIEVTGSGSAAASDAGGGGKVIAHTSHGDVHQVAGAPPPTQAEIDHSTQIVNQIANQQGEDYTQGQQQLPDVIPVGGDPGNAPPLPTGAGD